MVLDAELRGAFGRAKVAFLGPAASYSHQAVRSAFSESDWELLATSTIKEVFDVVQSGNAAYGVVPFENSSHGSVLFTLDNLADRGGVYGDVYICAEIYLDVHHFLLGYKNSAEQPARGNFPQGDLGTSTQAPGRPQGKPLTDLGHIRRVYSHPQAFGQTGVFRSAYLKGVESIDVSSTSKAAELAAADATGVSAAIAGELAASANSLEVLAERIEDHDDNTTRFFVLRKGSAYDDGGDEGAEGPPPLPDKLTKQKRGGGDAAEAGVGASDEQGDRLELELGRRSPYKSLVSFTVPTRSPGALADVLDCFRKYRLDLTSINSLPSLVQPFQYLFLVEFEGSRLDDADREVENALRDVAEVAQKSRWLGSWLNQRLRFSG